MKGKQLHAGRTETTFRCAEAFRGRILWMDQPPAICIGYRPLVDRPLWRDADGISVGRSSGSGFRSWRSIDALLALRHSRKDLREGDQEIVATDQPALLVRGAGTPA